MHVCVIAVWRRVWSLLGATNVHAVELNNDTSLHGHGRRRTAIARTVGQARKLSVGWILLLVTEQWTYSFGDTCLSFLLCEIAAIEVTI